jgi:hypothetical protein
MSERSIADLIVYIILDVSVAAVVICLLLVEPVEVPRLVILVLSSFMAGVQSARLSTKIKANSGGGQ